MDHFLGLLGLCGTFGIKLKCDFDPFDGGAHDVVFVILQSNLSALSAESLCGVTPPSVLVVGDEGKCEPGQQLADEVNVCFQIPAGSVDAGTVGRTSVPRLRGAAGECTGTGS